MLTNWHYSIFEKFNEMIFGKTLTENNFFDDGRVHQQRCLFQITEDGDYSEQCFPDFPDDLYFFKLVKGNEYYLLPRRHLQALPLVPKKIIQMKLKKTDTQVWKYITDMDSFSIPPRMTLNFKEFIIQWNNITHSNTDSQTLLKLICFSRGVKLGICGGVSLGKNCDRTLKRHIYGKTSPKVKSPTKAKFYTELYYNDDLNLDELTSWTKSDINIIEDIMAEYGDESPDFTKFSKDSNRLMECIKNINDRSFTFTFNPKSELNKFFIEDKFRNWDKIIDRYPILFFDGKVTGHFPRPNNAEREALVVENMPEIKLIASNTAYWWLNLSKHMHNYDRNIIKLTGRYLSNLTPLFVACDVYSDTQNEFNTWCLKIQDSIARYKAKYAKNCYLNNSQVTDSGQVEFREADMAEEFVEEV